MQNNSLKYGVSEVSKILKVEKDLIKKWSFYFKEYLNYGANPDKGVQRKYTINDFCIFNYINFYWEEEPDLESIKIGLNCKEHLEYPFNEIENELIPLFRELTEIENIDNLFIAGGILGGAEKLDLADSYKNSADLLVENIQNEHNKWTVFFPIIYLYRHSIELYFKAIIKEENTTHDLTKLLIYFNKIIETKFNTNPPIWFENMVKSFNDFDPRSTSFRYGNIEWEEEMVIDLKHIKKIINWSSESFHKIYKNL
ncbi:hypothetical protein Q4595_15940 [Wenyingzhuangia sp. 1_MG-2023]|nr:hypothetical protein [Wenyingzhuangia sp. 1_MG-2023]